jgi:hypothetical protein
MRAASGLGRRVFAHAPFAKFFESLNRVRPRFHCFHTTDRSLPRNTRFKTFQHRGRLALPEVAEPASQVGGGFGDHLGEADAAGFGSSVPRSAPWSERWPWGGDPPDGEVSQPLLCFGCFFFCSAMQFDLLPIASFPCAVALHFGRPDTTTVAQMALFREAHDLLTWSILNIATDR